MDKKLPNELLLQIFEDLTYFDVTVSIPAVCKLFRALVGLKTKALKEILYKFHGPPSAVDESVEYEVHPAFGFIKYNWKPDINEVKFRRKDSSVEVSIETVAMLDPELRAIAKDAVKRLIDSRIASENATSPAVRAMKIRYISESSISEGYAELDVGPGSSNNNPEKPVTVQDVMDVIVKEMRCLVTGTYSGRLGDFLEEEYEHWQGFERAEVEDGVLHLYLPVWKLKEEPAMKSTS